MAEAIIIQTEDIIPQTPAALLPKQLCSIILMHHSTHFCKVLQCDHQMLRSESAGVGRARMGIDTHHNKPPNKAALVTVQQVSEI